jgi:hypothetical protein
VKKKFDIFLFRILKTVLNNSQSAGHCKELEGDYVEKF